MKLRTLMIALGAVVLASVPSVVVAEAANDVELELVENNDVSDTQGRRELFSFWGFLFMMIHPHDCPAGLSDADRAACESWIRANCPPIGPPHHKCASNYIAETFLDDSTATASNRAEDTSTVAAEYVTYEEGGASTSEAGGANVSRSFSWLMLAVAAAAAAAAMIAAAIGQRRDRTDRHPMSGAIKRRVEQFSCFADGAICASTERPDRVVEMTLSQDDMAYELQNDKKAMV